MSASFSQSSLSSVCFCNLQRNRLVYLTKSDLHVLFQLIQYVCVPPISLSAWRKTSLWKISLAKSEATDFVIHCRRQMFIRLSRAIPYVMETEVSLPTQKLAVRPYSGPIHVSSCLQRLFAKSLTVLSYTQRWLSQVFSSLKVSQPTLSTYHLFLQCLLWHHSWFIHSNLFYEA